MFCRRNNINGLTAIKILIYQRLISMNKNKISFFKKMTLHLIRIINVAIKKQEEQKSERVVKKRMQFFTVIKRLSHSDGQQ